MTTAYPSLSHAQRIPLAAEIHSRPFLRLVAPEAITHLAVYRASEAGSRSGHGQNQHALLAQLCAHFGVAAPNVTANHFYHDFGRFRLKWECHTEFATYTFIDRIPADLAPAEAFKRVPLNHLPQSWILGLHGRVMAAAHVVLERGAADQAQLADLFGGSLVGSRVMQGGEAWTDFTIQPDGFSRFVLRDVDMRAQQAGRLTQRVLEIETYRMMALLGLPAAREVAASLDDIEAELALLSERMIDGGAAPERGDQDLLEQITRLAARLEKLSLDNGYRFSASKAYYRLVKARIEELRESRIEGVPTVEEFMDRRLTPAMNTCESTAARMDALARRIANVNDLLRTRVSIVQETQNRQILQSMDRRAAQQLRLQQAVEGLSVAAISYYMIGLLGYLGKAAKGLGLPVNPDVLTGALVPVVAGAVWLGLRRMHKRMHKRAHA